MESAQPWFSPDHSGFISKAAYLPKTVTAINFPILITTLLTSLAVLLRILSNPLGNVFQKSLTGRGHHPLLVNFLTYLLLSAICLFWIPFVNWQALPAAFWTWSALAGITGALGNGFLVRALQQGDLSVLGPINAYKSVVGILTGMVLLGEVPNLWGLLGVAIIIYGSYFVLGTTSEGFSWALLKKSEIRFRIWAMILTAIEAVFIKKIILTSNPATAFISWCVTGGMFSWLLLKAYRLQLKAESRKMQRTDLGQYLLLAGCIGTMQFTTNYVFDHMPVGYALSLFQLSTLVSVLLGYRLFQEKDIRPKLIGSLLMIAGSVLIILLKDQ